ncbi:uncharacterized protein LOC131662281 [Vicia villosa]|uniref:uncharacterized protein LOC131662281 n=1 Tax=Vicia villosa TaxID=3911 RepID=UPI00273C91E5|nr:uncharacterized protein LOC131662281 [Vicia villosa]
MEKINYHKIAFFTQSIRTHHNYLIKVTPLIVSLSLFPFIFSTSSLISFLHHFNFYFSTFSFQLFTHTIDKNCMFLLCNGLLVFVGITRSLSTGSSSVDESFNYVKDGSQSLYSMVETKVTVLVSEENDDEAKDINFEEGKGSSILVLEQEKEPKEESRLFDEEDEEKDSDTEMVDEEVLEEANWVLNTDELNKRFDDFIRRMKEDLRIEAQRQFVMA